MRVSFEPLATGHLPLLHGWLQQPHVRAFWDDGERTAEAVRAHYLRAGRDVPGFVFRVDGRAAGFIQRHHVSPDHEFAPWAAPDGETWAVDLLIGEADLTGRGLGPRVIGAFLDDLRTRRPALRRVLMDPDPANTRAVRAYTKAGFVAVGDLEDRRVMAWRVPPSV